MQDTTLMQIRSIPIASVVAALTGMDASKEGNIMCPLHGDKSTPSLHLYHDTNTFYCFGCKTGGDTIKFVEKLKGVGFWEACKLLASMFQIEIKEEEQSTDPNKKKQLREEDKYFNALERVITLQQARWGEIEKAHTELYNAVVARFGNPTDPNSITSRWGLCICDFVSLPLGMKWNELEGITEEYKAALLIKVDHTAMQHRVLIPIRNAWGRIVGFSARQLVKVEGTEYPKYLTSRGSRFFKKGEVLFGLDKAVTLARKTKTLNIVEGYADVMTLHQHGLVNTVALQGTALTATHLEQLRQLGVRLITLFPDRDAAGEKAVAEHTTTLIKAGFEVKVQLYGEEGDDPDSFFKTLA